MPHVEIIEPGHTKVTDLGRHASHMGLSNNGVMDEMAARCANAPLGNAADEPVLESLESGLTFAPSDHQLISVTGANSELRIDGRQVPTWTAHHVWPGQIIQVAKIWWGIRTYVALHGSLQADVLLDSCAPDPVLELDSRLHAGQRLKLRRTLIPRQAVWGTTLIRLTAPAPHAATPVMIDTTDGPHFEVFDTTIGTLYDSVFAMSHQSNEIGLRLTGRTPTGTSQSELVSSAVPIGSVELPGTDLVIVLHRGRGITAGYPIPAVVTRGGLDRLAQLRPGQQMQFRRSTVEQSVNEYRHRLSRLGSLQTRALEVVTRQFYVRQVGHQDET